MSIKHIIWGLTDAYLRNQPDEERSELCSKLTRFIRFFDDDNYLQVLKKDFDNMTQESNQNVLSLLYYFFTSKCRSLREFAYQTTSRFQVKQKNELLTLLEEINLWRDIVLHPLAKEVFDVSAKATSHILENLNNERRNNKKSSMSASYRNNYERNQSQNGRGRKQSRTSSVNPTI